jgi:hypothetical protein
MQLRRILIGPSRTRQATPDFPLITTHKFNGKYRAFLNTTACRSRPSIGVVLMMAEQPVNRHAAKAQCQTGSARELTEGGSGKSSSIDAISTVPAAGSKTREKASMVKPATATRALQLGPISSSSISPRSAAEEKRKP